MSKKKRKIRPEQEQNRPGREENEAGTGIDPRR